MENETTEDLLTRFILIVNKYNYNPSCRDTCKDDFFIHEVKYFVAHGPGNKQQTLLEYASR